jgi:DNA-directed RNA polymerase subunit beta'
MAVHVPLSTAAQEEARTMMLSTANLLSPADGSPVVAPTQDMVLGCYYLTMEPPPAPRGKAPKARIFADEAEAILAYQLRTIGLHDPIEAEVRTWSDEAGELVTERRRTTVGKIIFNGILPDEMRYRDDVMTRSQLKTLVDECYRRLGPTGTAHLVDGIKSVGFDYATRGGVTIGLWDIVTPADKRSRLESADQAVAEVDRQFQRGLITEDERYEQVVELWQRVTREVSDTMMEYPRDDNPVRMMTDSGARGNKGNIGQLGAMRGLMADPSGRIIDVPVRSNFREGMSVLEYFISTHGARKGLADTALRTADSGYLTRRLVDVSQDVIIRQEDCGTSDHVDLRVHTDDGINKSLYGRLLSEDVHKPLASGKPGKTVVATKGEEITMARLREIVEELGDEIADGFTIPVRSVLKCKAETGVCRQCYGTFLATGELSEIGDAVGIIAAQSIGEPGTQLTMRTFHTGGIAGADITHGLPRVVEIFEARNPKGAAVLAEVAGTVALEETERQLRITIIPDSGNEDDEFSVLVPRRTRLTVAQGEHVEAGDPLHEGSLNPGDLLRLKGYTETELYLVGEVQKVYKSQGVEIHDKHIELIVRQMLKKVRVENNGETELLPGQLVDKLVLERENARVKKEKKEQATSEPLILGITKASLATESFLSAASFQETTKVLTDAAIEGKVDRLLGLKENVIIGKLIPAATGLKRYRTIEIGPSDKVPASALARPQTEEQLLAALEEIGTDGSDALAGLGLDFGGEIAPSGDGEPRSDLEAEEVPEVESPLDE